MHTLLIILTSFYFNSAIETAVISGKIYQKDGITAYPGVIVELSHEDQSTYSAISSIDGLFEFTKLPSGTYSLSLKFVGHSKKEIKNLCIEPKNKLALVLRYPDNCEKSPRTCPLDHKNGVIPIEYGIATDKMKVRASKGQVYLGGCRKTDCEPRWFCNEHDLKF